VSHLPLGDPLPSAWVREQGKGRVFYTASGLQWYQGFARATAQAEAEFTAAVGEEVATVVRIALEMYGADAGRLA